MIIVDLGSKYVKYGISGTKKPLRIVLNRVYKNGSNYSLKSENTKNKKYIEPVKNGIIVNFNKMVVVWDFIFNDLKNVTSIKNIDILVSEPVFTSLEYKERLTNFLKSNYSINNVYFFLQQYLGLLGYCHTNGIVVDMGYNSIRIVPVYENYIINEAIVLLTSHVSEKYKNSTNYENVLAKPKIVDPDEITDALYECICKCPIDLRKELCNNIIVIGGSANYSISSIIKDDFIKKYKKFSSLLNITVPNNKNTLVWLGGSIMGTMLKTR